MPHSSRADRDGGSGNDSDSSVFPVCPSRSPVVCNFHLVSIYLSFLFLVREMFPIHVNELLLVVLDNYTYVVCMVCVVLCMHMR